MKTFGIGILVLTALLFTGCGAGYNTGLETGIDSGISVGLIYTHTWTPLTTDLHRTEVVTKSGEGDIKHIQIGQIGVAWDDASFGAIVKQSGLKELYFADLETFRVLTIWNQYTVHLYGK